MNKEIKLPSRDNLDNRLIRVGDEDSLMYTLKTNFNYRAGVAEDDDSYYTFIDPSGGPFITPGYEIEGHKVKTIHRGGIIEFES